MSTQIRSRLELAIEKLAKEFLPSNIKHLPAIYLEYPNDKSNGDLSSNAAFKLANIVKESPFHLANKIKQGIEKDASFKEILSSIERIEVKAPGFINFFLKPDAFFVSLKSVLVEKDNFGRINIGKKKKIQIEFVSANPTGPLSVAHARQAAVGDALANILNFLGFNLTKEYYINDEGRQIDILGKSIEARFKELRGESFEFPQEGYKGDYIYDIAKQIINDLNTKELNPNKLKEAKFFNEFGAEYILKIIQQDLADFKVEFNVYKKQSEITAGKSVEKIIKFLRKKGFIYDKDGAVWFKSTEFKDDKDRVLKKSDGSFTYLAPDIVYHRDKFKRGFKWLINIWGPDHHGYIPRLKAAVMALGKKESDLSIIIVQLATIFKEGKPISMSTRRAQYISLRDCLEEVGVDASRFFFLMRNVKAHLDFDLELAKKQSLENPVYYIQYAHARCFGIIELVKETNLDLKNLDLSRLKEPEEIELLKRLNEFSECLLDCYKLLDPYSLVSFLRGLASDFHKFYDRHRVIVEDTELKKSRFSLVMAIKYVLANGLRLLGVSSPDKM